MTGKLQKVRTAIAFSPIWLGAMAVHLWYIATGRPRYRLLPDTAMTSLSFLAVYACAALLRWNYLGGYSVASVTIAALAWCITLCLCIERKHRSSSLVAVCLGMSAVFDLLASAAFVVGAIDQMQIDAWFWLEVAAYIYCAWRFSKEPDAVRASGYGRPAKASRPN